ncbi:hypothetical protein TNCV_259661 [Trichonephila clavipes]|uniref:Uncharacterized protein n=1 Tax=Trichonephila clavipes TaxID=2585209 RepID=A0A8X6VBD0_TRICX|nr:hypothetical protein TNCV_259661 [Trichonephila clavipes]
MVTVKLRYEYITRSFLIDECRITEFFSGFIVNFIKHVCSTSPGMMLVDKELHAVQSILNVVAVRPESSIKAVAHHVSVSHQTVCSVKRKSLTPLLFSTRTSFESGRLSSPTASGRYSNVSCSWTS